VLALLDYIIEKLDLFIYGFYPPEAYWRPQWVLILALIFVWITDAINKMVISGKPRINSIYTTDKNLMTGIYIEQCSLTKVVIHLLGPGSLYRTVWYI
jgi:hypothetical protein